MSRHRQHLRERPRDWRYTAAPHKLKRGLVFHMGGWMAGSSVARDGGGNTARRRWHGTFSSLLPSAWQYSRELGRHYLVGNGTGYVLVNSGLPTGDSTLAAWVRWDGANIGRIIGHYIARLDFRIQTGGTLSYRYYDGGSWHTSSSVALTANTWQHVCATRSGTAGLIIYVDGVPRVTEATFTPAAEAHNYFGVLGYPLSLPGLAPGGPLAGDVGDAMVFSRVLSPAEVCALADRSNVDLDGLIVTRRRRALAAVGGSMYYYEHLLAGRAA